MHHFSTPRVLHIVTYTYCIGFAYVKATMMSLKAALTSFCQCVTESFTVLGSLKNNLGGTKLQMTSRKLEMTKILMKAFNRRIVNES